MSITTSADAVTVTVKNGFERQLVLQSANGFMCRVESCTWQGDTSVTVVYPSGCGIESVHHDAPLPRGYRMVPQLGTFLALAGMRAERSSTRGAANYGPGLYVRWTVDGRAGGVR